MECLDDRDDSIRLRALDLISGMVSKKNLMEIVRKLVSHMDTSESASALRVTCVVPVIQMCFLCSHQAIVMKSSPRSSSCARKTVTSSSPTSSGKLALWSHDLPCSHMIFSM